MTFRHHRNVGLPPKPARRETLRTALLFREINKEGVRGNHPSTGFQGGSPDREATGSCKMRIAGSLRPPKAWPLHDRARRQTGGVGLKQRLHWFGFCHLAVPISAGYTVLFAVECRSPHHGPSKASAPQCPERDHRGVAGRIARSPRPVPAGTTFRHDYSATIWMRRAAAIKEGCGSR